MKNSIGICALLLAFGMSSCSEGGDVPSVVPSERNRSSEVSVGLELEMPIDDPVPANGARAAYLFGYDLSSHKTYLKPTLKLKEGDSVPVVAYLRRKMLDASVSSLRIEANWKVKIGANGKRMLYLKKDKMNLPSGWTLDQIPGNDYHLMAMVGGNRQGDEVCVSLGDGKWVLSKSGDEVKLPGIYLMDWTKLKIQGTTLQAAGEVKSFAPQGAILVMKAHNKIGYNVDLRGFRVGSNVFDFSGSYKDLGKVVVGSSPKFTAEEKHSVDYLFSNSSSVSLSSGQSSPYLVCWVMPRGDRGLWKPRYSSLSTPCVKVSGLIKGQWWQFNSLQATKVWTSTRFGLESLRSGYFYGFDDVVINRRKQCLPIEAFYFRNEDTGIPEWWAPYNSKIQPNKYENVEDYVTNSTRDIVTRRYHTPSIAEWRTIFPPLQGGTKQGGQSKDMIVPIRFENAGTHTNLSEDIKVWGEASNYKADYRNTGYSISYAIRFKDGNGNRYRAAYRYEASNRGGEEDYVKVTVRELGPNRTNVTLDMISNEQYWNSEPDVNQCQVVRFIPRGYYWSSTASSLPKHQALASCRMKGFAGNAPYFLDGFFCDDRQNHSAPIYGNRNTHFVLGVTSERE